MRELKRMQAGSPIHCVAVRRAATQHQRLQASYCEYFTPSQGEPAGTDWSQDAFFISPDGLNGID
jgi:hypothetical protein